MCTWITERAEVSGGGKGAQGWFHLRQANVYYDHPSYARMEHALMIDFVNPEQGPSARVAVELSPDSARELVRSIMAALEAGEDQHSFAEAQNATPVGRP